MPVFLLISLSVILIFLVVFLLYQPLGKGSEYRPQDEEPEHLNRTRFDEDKYFRRTFGRASLEERKGLFILKLKGSRYEMGLQHGKLLKQQIHKGVVSYHADFVGNFSGLKKAPWIIRRFYQHYLDWKFYRPLMKYAPRDFLEEIKGLADGCDLPFDLVLRGNLLSEVNMNRVVFNQKKQLRNLPQSECSSFAAYGHLTEDGSMLVGRNTDYSGAGLWDRYQTIFFYEPVDGYRFVNIGTAGLLKSNSCMNEAGLCLGGHFLYSEDVSTKGIGFTALEYEIMTKTSSMGEAYRLVSSSARAGAFAFLIASAREKEACVIECTASKSDIRFAEKGVIYETNFMTTPALKPVDFLIRHGLGKNPKARYARFEQVLAEFSGQITPQKAAEFMGDHYNICSQSFRPLGDVIATLNNLTSVVFNPDRLVFWVASGLAPVCNNPYYGFDFNAEYSDQVSSFKPSVLAPNNYIRTVGYETLKRYYPIRKAVKIESANPTEYFSEIEQIVKTVPGESVYRIVLAKILLSMNQPEKAEEHLRMSQEGILSLNEQAQVDLLFGFSYDLRGEHNKALPYYHSILSLHNISDMDILSSVNPFLALQAKKYSRKGFSTKNLQELDISLDMNSLLDL